MPRANWTRHDFDSRAQLAQALAATIAGQLREAITLQDRALLAVSGGTTPALLFETLSKADLDWDKVTVTLIDERFVPDSSPRSNARLVENALLKNNAVQAAFAPLYRADTSPEDAALAASADLGKLGLPLDVAILGMGDDGHTASFFPDATELDALLDTAAKPIVAPVHAESAGEPRLTLTLPTIAAARFIALHIEGASKAATLDKALAPASTLPIRRVIDAAQMPVEIFWAP